MKYIKEKGGKRRKKKEKEKKKKPKKQSIYRLPTRSRGMRRSSLPCLRNTFPEVCSTDTPTPSEVCVWGRAKIGWEVSTKGNKTHKSETSERKRGAKREQKVYGRVYAPLVMIALVSYLTLNCDMVDASESQGVV